MRRITFKTIFPRLLEFLGLRRNIVYLLSLTILILTGEKLWDRYLPKYLEGIGATTLITFLGGWLWKQNPAINLFTATAFGIIGTLLFIFYGKGTKGQ